MSRTEQRLPCLLGRASHGSCMSCLAKKKNMCICSTNEDSLAGMLGRGAQAKVDSSRRQPAGRLHAKSPGPRAGALRRRRRRRRKRTVSKATHWDSLPAPVRTARYIPFAHHIQGQPGNLRRRPREVFDTCTRAAMADAGKLLPHLLLTPLRARVYIYSPRAHRPDPGAFTFHQSRRGGLTF